MLIKGKRRWPGSSTEGAPLAPVHHSRLARGVTVHWEGKFLQSGCDLLSFCVIYLKREVKFWVDKVGSLKVTCLRTMVVD